MATDNNGFQIVGPKQISAPVLLEQTKHRLPSVSFAILGIIVIGCLLANVIATKDPSYMDLMNYTKAPNREFLFGTDNLGRDIFSCIWYGGRISLSVGVIATVISTVLAILYGSVSGLASDMVDTIMMRGAEIVLTIPSILLVIFIQAILGEPTTLSIAFVIGITSCAVLQRLSGQRCGSSAKANTLLPQSVWEDHFFIFSSGISDQILSRQSCLWL